MAKDVWVPPPDPDFAALADVGYSAWCRDRPDLVAFDTETYGVEFHDQTFCGTVAWNGAQGIECHYFEFREYDGRDLFSDILKRTPRWVGHNIKFDIQKCLQDNILDRKDVLSSRLEDTECLAHLDDEHRLKGLKKLAVSVLGVDDTIDVETQSGPNKGQIRKVPREKYELDAVRRKLKKKIDDGFHVIPRAIIVPYALKDAEFTLRLYHALKPRIEAHADLLGLYRQEMTLTCVLLDMERHGLGVNKEYVDRMIAHYRGKVLGKELEIESVVGKAIGKGAGEFNPNSNPQIAAHFGNLGFVRESYDEENLRSIENPLADLLLGLRSDQKILNTYFMALKRGTRDGVFHPSIRQHGTVTGRTSSGGARADG